MKNIKILFISLFLILLFPLFVKAEENTYFDLPQEVVSELPTASSDTLNKIYVVDNKYYVTNEVQEGGTPTYLPLNTELNGYTIYFDYANWYNACIMNNYARWSTTEGLNNDFYRKVGADYCLSNNSFGLKYATINYNDNSILTSNGSNNYLVNVNGSKVTSYAKSFILNNTLKITNVNFEEYYHLFSTTPFESEIIYSWVEVTEEQVFRVKPTKTYVPSNNLYCYHFISDNILRGYVSQPVLNENIEYYDFNLDYHYRQTTGTETITLLPTCIANTTNDYLYREDILQVLSYFLIITLVVIGIPTYVFMRLFKKGKLK